MVLCQTLYHYDLLTEFVLSSKTFRPQEINNQCDSFVMMFLITEYITPFTAKDGTISLLCMLSCIIVRLIPISLVCRYMDVNQGIGAVLLMNMSQIMG